jgi:hypothetical protein
MHHSSKELHARAAGSWHLVLAVPAVGGYSLCRAAVGVRETTQRLCKRHVLCY